MYGTNVSCITLLRYKENNLKIVLFYNNNHVITSTFIPQYIPKYLLPAQLLTRKFKVPYKYILLKILKYVTFKEDHIFFLFWCDSPQWTRASFTRFLDYTHWRTTVGRTLWTSDQLVAETSTWQNTTLTTDKHPWPRWDSKPQSQQARGRRPTP
jgi:hypothetical protein